MSDADTAVEKDPLEPDPRVLAKAASVIVHVIEQRSPGGHAFDEEAIATALADEELRAWLRGMVDLQLAPVPRDKRLLE